MSTVQLKRSATASKVPLVADLQLGELALNTYDGRLFFKKDPGTAAIVTVATTADTQTLTNKTLSSPVITGTITANGSVGTAGQALVSNGSGVYFTTISSTATTNISDSAPALPAAGDLWFDSTDGSLNIYYNDGTSSQWVSAISNQTDAAYIVKTANYTATNRDHILADTTGGAFTITLPASPAIGHNVVLYDNNSWGTNNLTVARNGNTIETLADDFTLDVSSIKVEFIYNGSTWQIYSSLGQSAQAASGISNATAAALAIALG
jgi:hypothetical protein